MNKIVSRVSRYEFPSETNIHENYGGINAIGIMAQENKIKANTECFCRVEKRDNKASRAFSSTGKKEQTNPQTGSLSPKSYKLEDYKRCRNMCSRNGGPVLEDLRSVPRVFAHIPRNWDSK